MLELTEIRAAVGPCPPGLAPPDEFWVSLHRGYQTPQRYYHTFDHVAEVARWYHQVASERAWMHPREVFLAVLFHDVVYEIGAKDNEHQSAIQARAAADQWLSDHHGLDLDFTARLIELTARHGTLSPDEVSDEEAYFLDCDMAILGAEDADYDRYEADVAAEYQTLYPAPLYRQGRAHFVRELLKRGRIYLSPYFHDQLDVRARANMQRALSSLTADG